MAKKSDSTVNQVPQDEIARCAYQLWEQEGRPDGRSTEHWLQAEQIVRGRQSPVAATAAPANSDGRPRKGVAPRSTAPARGDKRFEMVS